MKFILKTSINSRKIFKEHIIMCHDHLKTLQGFFPKLPPYKSGMSASSERKFLFQVKRSNMFREFFLKLFEGCNIHFL